MNKIVFNSMLTWLIYLFWSQIISTRLLIDQQYVVAITNIGAEEYYSGMSFVSDIK